MPQDDKEVCTPSDWLVRARSNLAIGKTGKTEEVLWEDLCFNLQQAAEKAIKAVLLLRNVEFPFTHQLGRLVQLLTLHNISWPDGLERIDDLSDYSVQTRYPGDFEPVDEGDYEEALRLAETVVDWAERMLRGEG